MAGEISVCHVVNVVRDTSMPGDLATTQATLDEIETVGILAWKGVEPFRNMDSIEIHNLDVSDSSYRVTPTQYREARSVLEEYDIVHTHHNHSGFYAKLIANRLGKPIVVTEHNNHGGFTRKGRIANGLTNALADEVACVSESVRDSFAWWENRLVSNSSVSVVENGVDLERLESARETDWSIHDVADIHPDAIVVGSAGMLTEQKAHDVLIDAVDRANANYDRPIELVISGDGPLRSELERQISLAKHSSRLHLLGFLEERRQVYKMMDEIDIYAMPSRWEGFCVAALEALAVENACVFSDIPEFRSPFEDVASFHEVDNPEHCSEKIVSLVKNDDYRNHIAREAKSLVTSEYTLEKTARRYFDKYLDSSSIRV
ncbi:glycosyltransferase family 4 protein [Natrarchaeobius oligotrophus]|uniref:Glycosyltransferase n=1 Tax=Natrarchaeobius chitinivorans TaxID=1679083 RepID=A0A3N6MKN1_NATCH|nr:glycosyltransferase family 4 protein [Natrarchaeobius chitinivorans]RQH01955.1 glycosyltransferase [Natrarchaeobius chitinivorans]